MVRIAAEFEVRASLIDVSAPHRRNHSPPPEVQPRSRSISRGTLQIRKMPSGIGKTHVLLQRPALSDMTKSPDSWTRRTRFPDVDVRRLTTVPETAPALSTPAVRGGLVWRTDMCFNPRDLLGGSPGVFAPAA